MAETDVRRIKVARKEAQIFREFSTLFLRLTLDDSRLQGLMPTHVQISRDGGSCTIFFYSEKGEEDFQEHLPYLILYKPSLRKALSQVIPARYTPELIFRYDDKVEKQRKIERLLDSIKTEEPS